MDVLFSPVSQPTALGGSGDARGWVVMVSGWSPKFLDTPQVGGLERTSSRLLYPTLWAPRHGLFLLYFPPNPPPRTNGMTPEAP